MSWSDRGQAGEAYSWLCTALVVGFLGMEAVSLNRSAMIDYPTSGNRIPDLEVTAIPVCRQFPSTGGYIATKFDPLIRDRIREVVPDHLQET